MLIRTRNPYNRLFHDLFGEFRPIVGANNEFGTAGHGLPIDVEENDEGYIVRADLPGRSEEAISVNIHDDVLSISAETVAENSDENGRVLIRERRIGKFSRSLRFPAPVNGEAIAATYDNGVLTINLPKAEHVKPRQIPVTVNSGANYAPRFPRPGQSHCRLPRRSAAAKIPRI